MACFDKTTAVSLTDFIETTINPLNDFSGTTIADTNSFGNTDISCFIFTEVFWTTHTDDVMMDHENNSFTFKKV